MITDPKICIQLYNEKTCDNINILCADCLIGQTEICGTPHRDIRVPNRNKYILAWLQKTLAPEELFEALL